MMERRTFLVGSAMGYGIGRYVYKAHHVKPSSAVSEEESLKRARRWPILFARTSPASQAALIGADQLKAA